MVLLGVAADVWGTGCWSEEDGIVVVVEELSPLCSLDAEGGGGAVISFGHFDSEYIKASNMYTTCSYLHTYIHTYIQYTSVHVHTEAKISQYSGIYICNAVFQQVSL